MKKCFSFFRGKALALMIATIILVLVSSILYLFQPVTLQLMINQIPKMVNSGSSYTAEQVSEA